MNLFHVASNLNNIYLIARFMVSRKCSIRDLCNFELSPANKYLYLKFDFISHEAFFLFKITLNQEDCSKEYINHKSIKDLIYYHYI